MSENKSERALKDIELCIQATKALQSKLEKLASSLQEIFAESGTEQVTRARTPVQPTRRTSTSASATPSASVQPTRPSVASTPVSSTPITSYTPPRSSGSSTQLIDEYMNYLRTSTNASEASDKLERLRDALIAATGHHPAFYEMAKWISNLKRYRDLDSDIKEDLLDELEDWKRRLSRDI